MAVFYKRDISSMKKQGVINQALSAALAGLGHGDYFLLCDSGFPVPKNVDKVDLALSFGVPSMRQCIKAIVSEIVIQKITIAKEMYSLNEEGYEFLKTTFVAQEFKEIPQSELLKLAANAKFVLRSGELGCYSNILIEAASGVWEFKKNLIIDV